MKGFLPRLGFGIGWRPELSLWIQRCPDLGFVEVVAENIESDVVPLPLKQLRERGVTVIPHGISLSLGGAEPPERLRLDHLARLAVKFDSPLVSEHVAFVRAGDCEAGHLLPVPRTAYALDVLVENIRFAQAALPVPLAVENISTLIEWPDADMDEPTFFNELVTRTGVLLLLDIANVYANAKNHGWDAVAYLEKLPWESIAYVHVGGGIVREGIYHDTHAHAVDPEIFVLLEKLCARAVVAGIMLERDDAFPDDEELTAEFDALVRAVRRGQQRRETADVHF